MALDGWVDVFPAKDRLQQFYSQFYQLLGYSNA